MAYDDGDNFLKGPEFVAWLRAHLTKHRPELRLEDALQRRLWEWEKEGVLASFATVDRWLTRYDIRPQELPDDMWVPGYRRCLVCGEDIGLHTARAQYCATHRHRYQNSNKKAKVFAETAA